MLQESAYPLFAFALLTSVLLLLSLQWTLTTFGWL